MRFRQAATGFFGVILLAAFTVGPTLVARKATAKLMEQAARTATVGHGIVQAGAGVVPTRRSDTLEHEHLEGELHVEAETPEEPTPPQKPAHPPASPKIAPQPVHTSPVADAPVDVDDLKQALMSQAETLPICRRANGPEGPGIAEVTFTGDGRARVGLSPPYANTPVGSCVARRLAGAAPSFDGEPVTLRIRFELCCVLAVLPWGDGAGDRPRPIAGSRLPWASGITRSFQHHGITALAGGDDTIHRPLLTRDRSRDHEHGSAGPIDKAGRLVFDPDIGALRARKRPERIGMNHVIIRTSRFSRIMMGAASIASFVLVGTSACSGADDSAAAPNPNGKDQGAACTDGSECKSLTCKEGKCTAFVAGGNPKDGVRNGDETDVDCGGEAAPACADGKACKVGDDCASGACTGGKCKAPAPDDKIKNGDETDVDCGGTKAPKCGTDKACESNADCASDACSYAKKCAEFKSCTGHFGGDTCGTGETGEATAKHESCCKTVTHSSGKRIGKYLVTAGRMRAFVERYGGNLQQWASTSPDGWNDDWTQNLPASMDDALFMLGPGLKRGCSITQQGKGARTYWQQLDGDTSDFSKDVLDEKALNCVPWHLAQALCVFDGGRLPTHAENMAIVTNDGENAWPWQFQDTSPYNESRQDERVVHRYSYATPNPPATMRMDGDSPLDRSFFVAPPGRRPRGTNKLGVQDAVGNLLVWTSDAPRRFSWTMSWEQHDKDTKVETWPPGSNNEVNGYYAIGARCVFE